MLNLFQPYTITPSLASTSALPASLLAGVVMPPSFDFRKIVADPGSKTLSVDACCSRFSVITGLRTQIGLLNDGQPLGLHSGWILLVALRQIQRQRPAAKIVGQSWRQSFHRYTDEHPRAPATDRFSIWYDLGCVYPEMFAMMVLMAL